MARWIDFVDKSTSRNTNRIDGSDPGRFQRLDLANHQTQVASDAVLLRNAESLGRTANDEGRGYYDLRPQKSAEA